MSIRRPKHIGRIHRDLTHILNILNRVTYALQEYEDTCSVPERKLIKRRVDPKLVKVWNETMDARDLIEENPWT